MTTEGIEVRSVGNTKVTDEKMVCVYAVYIGE